MSAATTERTAESRPGTRAASLLGGRTLVVRPVAHGDVDGLAALYAGLDDDARYRRFFSIYRPDRDFFEHITTIEERGGAGLVAAIVESRPRGPHRGGGELRAAPRRERRAGHHRRPQLARMVGPYLLDAPSKRRPPPASRTSRRTS